MFEEEDVQQVLFILCKLFIGVILLKCVVLCIE